MSSGMFMPFTSPLGGGLGAVVTTGTPDHVAGPGTSGLSAVVYAALLVNGKNYVSLGFHTSGAITGNVRIYRQVSSTSYELMLTKAVSHGGSGFEDFALDAPWQVPPTGNYYVGWYHATGNTTYFNSIAGASKVGDQTGITTGWTDSPGGATLYGLRGTQDQ